MAALSDATKSDVAIVLVPGSFCQPEMYNNTTKLLVSSGFENVNQCRLLSADAKAEQKPRPATMEDDAFYIREVINAYLSKGRDVVLVANSYGGFPSTEALKGLPSRSSLSAKKNEKGKSLGAVLGVVYLSSFVPLPGDDSRTLMKDYVAEPMKTGVKGEYMDLIDGIELAVFSDWVAEGGKEDEIKYWSTNMITHSSDSFDGKISYDMWAEDGGFQGKVVYVLGENDMIIPVPLAEEMFDKIQKHAGEGRFEVKRYEKGGHAMHVTKPEVVVDAVQSLLSGLQ